MLSRRVPFIVALITLLCLLGAILFAAEAKARVWAPFSYPGVQTATARNWGPVIAGDEFNTMAPLKNKWSVYNGPGHHKQGIRSPQAWHLTGHSVYVHGDSAGTTGGMSAKWAGADRKFGRYEVRMRTTTRDPRYHAVLILWPQDGYARGKCDGEVDFSESTRNLTVTNFYLHHGCDNKQVSSKTVNDTTAWHNYAVEWTPTSMTGYIDNKVVFRNTNVAYLPPQPMHPTIQLDYFPGDGTGPLKPTDMAVDWIRVYK